MDEFTEDIAVPLCVCWGEHSKPRTLRSYRQKGIMGDWRKYTDDVIWQSWINNLDMLEMIKTVEFFWEARMTRMTFIKNVLFISYHPHQAWSLRVSFCTKLISNFTGYTSFQSFLMWGMCFVFKNGLPWLINVCQTLHNHWHKTVAGNKTKWLINKLNFILLTHYYCNIAANTPVFNVFFWYFRSIPNPFVSFLPVIYNPNFN